MNARVVALSSLVCAVPGCTSIGDPPGSAESDRADASAQGFPDAAPRPDAAAVADAAAEPDAVAKPDAAMTVPATVTAPCLFLRQGPGTDQPKIDCLDAPQAWCNADGDVCMPMNDTMQVTGPAEAGAGCTEWFPGTYRDYEGYACGDYLQFPAAAAPWPKGKTLYPGAGAGPQG